MFQKERYIFYITNPYKNKIIQFSFHTDVTIKYFTEFITDEFMYYLKPNHTIEIVENTQFTNMNNSNELAPKINYPETSTLSEIFSDRWEKTSFYIRIKPYTKSS
jgi:hypothetical protein